MKGLHKLSGFLAVLFVLLWGWSVAPVYGASPDQLLKEGAALREKGEIDQAILKFQEALKSKPARAKASFELGECYLAKSDCENGIISLKDALEFGFDELKAHLALARAYETCGNPTEAVIEYQLALSLNPKSAEIRTLLGNAYAKEGSTLAEGEFRKALEFDSTYVPALLGLANMYQTERKYEEALSFYKRAKAIRPQHAATYLALGSFYIAQRDYETANAELTKYTELKPASPEGYAALANLHSKTRDFAKAVEEIRKAISLGDTTMSSLMFSAYLYGEAGMTMQEKEALREIVTKDSMDVNSWLALAKSSTKLDSFALAIQAYNKVLSLDPTILPNIAFEFGMVYYQAAKYDSAQVMFSKKIEQDSTSSGAYFNRALAAVQLKDYKQATADLEKGIQLRPDYAQGHLWLAQVYAFLNMKTKAKAECNVVLKLDPDNKEASDLLMNLSKPPPKQPTYEDYWDEDEEENQ